VQLVVSGTVAVHGGGDNRFEALAQRESVLLVHGDSAEDEGVTAVVRAGLLDEQQIHGHPSRERKSRVS
jgi:hypothetical protein